MKIGKYYINIYSSDSVNKRRQLDSVEIEKKYQELLTSGKRLIIGTMVGRSGARWLCDIFSAHSNAKGSLERRAEMESFWRYIKFNQLNIDTSGIITEIQNDIINDWKDHNISLVFSPYFSHGLAELVSRLRPETIIFATTEPRRIIQSIYNKDFFVETYQFEDIKKAIGYQPELVNHRWSHFFGRVIPSGADYEKWKTLTRIGKVAWWANRMTHDIVNQLREIKTDTLIFDLEETDQNFEFYQRMAQRFGLFPLLSQKVFLSLKGKTVKKTDNTIHDWTSEEEGEFSELTKAWCEKYSSKDLL